MASAKLNRRTRKDLRLRSTLTIAFFIVILLVSAFMNPRILLLLEFGSTRIDRSSNISAATNSRVDERSSAVASGSSVRGIHMMERSTNISAKKDSSVDERSSTFHANHPSKNETMSSIASNASFAKESANQPTQEGNVSREAEIVTPLPSILGVFGYASTSRRPFDSYSNVGEDVSTNKPITWSGYPSAVDVMTVFREDGKENELDTELFRQGFDVLPLWTLSGNETTQDDESRRSIEHVLVSGYFPMESKFPQTTYQGWIINFLALQDAMVIFTDSSMVPFFSENRRHAINRTVLVVARPNSKNIHVTERSNDGASLSVKGRKRNVSLEDADLTGFWSLPVRHIYQHLDKKTTQFIERNLPRLAPIPPSNHNMFWHAQFAMDVEYSIHKGPPLFWVWHSKTWMVQKAIQLSLQTLHQESAPVVVPPLFPAVKLFSYLDIGFFRDADYNNKMLLQHPEVYPTDRLLLATHQEPSPPPLPPLDNSTNSTTDRIDSKLWNDKGNAQFNYQVGGAFGGSPRSWQRYHNSYLQVMDRFVRAGMFVGEDQPLFQQTCNAFPELCAYIRPDDSDNWFHMRKIMHKGIVPPATLWYPPAD
jgi:hypothetical protein